MASGDLTLSIESTVTHPGTDNLMDLGESALEFKNLYLDGLAYIDGLGENMLITSTFQIQFRDTAIYINSTNDGYLDLYADGGIRIHGMILNITTQTGATYTILSTDDVVLCNSASDMTVTLPVATGSGKVYYIKNIHATTMVTLDGNGSDTIDGNATLLLARQYDSVEVIDGAANVWYILVDNR